MSRDNEIIVSAIGELRGQLDTSPFANPHDEKKLVDLLVTLAKGGVTLSQSAVTDGFKYNNWDDEAARKAGNVADTVAHVFDDHRHFANVDECMKRWSEASGR